MIKCEFCGKEFEKRQSLTAHYGHCEERLGKEGYNLSLEKRRKYQKVATDARTIKLKKLSEEKLQMWISEEHTCENCGKVMTEKYASGRFCCRGCSMRWVSIHQSDEAKARKVEKGKGNLEKGRIPGRRARGYCTDAKRHKLAREEILKGLTSRRTPIQDILSNKKGCTSNKLKYKLLDEGMKAWKCEQCGITEWDGNKTPLELHHKDGNVNNNSLDNLELLCPNCHALTKNYRGKNVKSRRENA